MINGPPAPYDKQAWSWGYQILPYTDHAALWSLPSGQKWKIYGTPISLYFCPSRRRPVALSGGPWASEKVTWAIPVAMTDYAGNAGFTAGLDTASDDGDYGDRDGLLDGVVVGQSWARPERRHGRRSRLAPHPVPPRSPGEYHRRDVPNTLLSRRANRMNGLLHMAMPAG